MPHWIILHGNPTRETTDVKDHKREIYYQSPHFFPPICICPLTCAKVVTSVRYVR